MCFSDEPEIVCWIESLISDMLFVAYYSFNMNGENFDETRSFSFYYCSESFELCIDIFLLIIYLFLTLYDGMNDFCNKVNFFDYLP